MHRADPRGDSSDERLVKLIPSDTPWQHVRGWLRKLTPTRSWRRATTIALIVAVQAAVLTVTYHEIVTGHTLLTGNAEYGTGGPPPYGYPGPRPSSNDLDGVASAWQWVPQIRKAHDLIANGELPLWNANVMLGAPLAGDPINGLFNPYTWPLVAHPATGAWDVWLLSRLLVASLLCTLLASYLGLGSVAATIAGLVFMMSGAFQLRVTTIQTSVMALLPLLILAVERCIRHPTRWSSALLALAVAATMLFGMPEQTFLCLLMAVIYFAVRCGAQWTSKRRPPSVKVAYSAFGGGFVGFLLSLPLVVPFLEYARAGVTTHGSDVHPALLVQNARHLLRLVGPHWNSIGPLSESSYAAVDNWFGIGALLLALLGAFSRALPRGVRTLLVVTAIAIEAKNVGFPDWFNQIVGNTPVLGQITFTSYSAVFVSLAVALLAGAGFQRIELGQVRRIHVVAAACVLGAITAAASPIYLGVMTARQTQVAITSSVLLLVVAGALVAAGRGRRIELRRVRRIHVVTAVCVLGAITAAALPTYLAGLPATHAQVAVTVVVLFLLVAGALIAAGRGRRQHTCGLLLCAASVTVELIVLAMPALQMSVRYDPLSSTPTTALLQQLMPSGSGRSYSATTTLFPTTNSAFNIDDVRDLDAIYIERSYRYLKFFVDPTLTDRFDGLAPNAANFVHNPFFNALNVKYILVAPPLSSGAADLPPDQFVLQAVGTDGVGIYRNVHASPRAQVFFNVTSATSEQGAASVMRQPGFDPTQRAVVEAVSTLPVSNHAPIPAHIDSYADTHVAITTTADQPGTLVLADAYYPGWQAQLDGKPAPIFPADIAMRGIQVPAGRHTLTMEYRPESVEFGALGVPAGLVTFALAGWAVPAVRRRRHQSRLAS